MLCKDETNLKYGYDTNTLAPTSNLPIWWECDKCHEQREYSYAYYMKKKEQAKENGGCEICQKCAHEHRKGIASTKKKEGQTWQPLPPEVDIKATQERYGYDPRDLSPWSRKLIIVTCPVTGFTSEIKRCGINTSKSVIETGHYNSVGACTAKRRTGVKASEKTKKSMAQSQKIRRLREKEAQVQENTVGDFSNQSQWQPKV